tara:strand:+ start:153 stop:506 length:354 start_codon:yes stop_codon:yes gene_type:complete
MIIKMKPTPLFTDTANSILKSLNEQVAIEDVESLFDAYIKSVEDEAGEIKLEVEIPRLQNAFNAGYEAGRGQEVPDDQPAVKDVKDPGTIKKSGAGLDSLKNLPFPLNQLPKVLPGG